MSAYPAPRLFSIPVGAPFLETLADALLSGRLVPGFAADGDPLKLADATVYVPTRRAARELRAIFTRRSRAAAAILPVIRPLGDVDEDALILDGGSAAALDLAPPIGNLERLLRLAPLVQAWKRRLPAHVAALFAEDIVVPASNADAIWLARDLAALMDEVETEGADWGGLAALAGGELAAWWDVTLKFLEIATAFWPEELAALDRSNPAAHRAAMIDAETARLAVSPPRGPVVAAGSTGSIPATARLLAQVARLPQGAVVLPGLDLSLDAKAWAAVGESRSPASAFGHPQFGLKKLLSVIGIERGGVAELGAASPALAQRASIVSVALRPAETTEDWISARPAVAVALRDGAFDGVTLVEAANEREEAMTIALALREAAGEDGRHAALVTGDRELARRVSAELLRFGIRADDSGGTPLASTPPGRLFAQALEAALRPGDPASVLALLKHPLLRLGRTRGETRRLVELAELVVLRGGTGRPDAATLDRELARRLDLLADAERKPFWIERISSGDVERAQALLRDLAAALAPLSALRGTRQTDIAAVAQASVLVFEALGRDEDGGVADLYGRDAGEAMAAFLRDLIAAPVSLDFAAEEWPDIAAALVSGETVKPSAAGDPRISIWGALEARLQSVDLLVVGGLNEGVWPRKAEADRFMSRMMKTGIELEPPERRIGLAAHDFAMALGAERLVLTRSARAGDAPAVASRWLQRLLAVLGEDAARPLRRRGETWLAWARAVDAGPDVEFSPRPEPKPPVAVRPVRFSVTEIETLRRDPYAVYARRILRLSPLDPLVRDPGAAERGTLFHEILHRFVGEKVDARDADALERLVAIGRACFGEEDLPGDIEAVWWPRFLAMAPQIVRYERERDGVLTRLAEAVSGSVMIADTGVTLSGRADRIDLLPGDLADILDYKTGYSPSKRQAHTLLAPQLALEGALLRRGGFAEAGRREPGDLAYVRLRASGAVEHESILTANRATRLASDLSEDAWSRLQGLMRHYADPATGYLSRALPFREGDTEGDYDHLARVLEWSAGGGDGDDGGEA